MDISGLDWRSGHQPAVSTPVPKLPPPSSVSCIRVHFTTSLQILLFRYSSGIVCVGRTYHAFAAYNYVILYDHDCITVKAILRAHSNKVTAVAAADSSGHQVVLSSGRDKVAIAWSVERHSFVRKQKLPGEPTALIACPHDHNKAILALTTGSCVVWDWSKGMGQATSNLISTPCQRCTPA